VSRLHRQHGEREDHPTQKPLEIIERMVLASCPEGGTVLDPFMGSGTSAVAAARHGRRFIGFELNPEYFRIVEKRVADARNGKNSGNRKGHKVHEGKPLVPDLFD
jgi:site-specific DNA-methyltransferase (adenine-specific)